MNRLFRLRGRAPVRGVLVGWALGALAAVAIGYPGSASGQDAGARRLEDALPPEYVARIREIARQASEDGVPPGLISRKAFEGAAKGYPPQRIVSALDAYAGRLRTASGLIGAGRRPGSMAAAAEALRRGVSPDAIRSIADRSGPGKDLTVPLIVLGDLSAAGVPTEHALEMVSSAMDRGTRGDQMLGLSAAIRRRMNQGADWRTAVDQVRRRVEMQRQLRDGATRDPDRRPDGATPVPPGSEPPHRMRDGS